MTDRVPLIEALVDDLVPVRPAPPLARTWAFWTLAAWIIVGAIVLSTGALREGALETLAESPRYALEFLLSVMCSAAAILAGLEAGVPGSPGPRRLALPALVFGLAWIALVAYGVRDPVIEVSMLGKRALCSVQTILFALPLLGVALHALHRRALHSRTSSGVLLGIGAAAIPAAMMQLACLHDPFHTLTHHILAVALAGLIGGWAARRLRTAQ